ncbi:MAG TPA: PQQ-binding-like beta-propeller repeat protein [Marmoricola sp.]|nr:PQQ-binding-like beta-propeller repeat protein [Marmoricola sp.]
MRETADYLVAAAPYKGEHLGQSDLQDQGEVAMAGITKPRVTKIRRPLIGTGLVLALSVVALAGCGQASKAAPPARAGWSTTGVSPVSQPVAVGDSVVVYVKSSSGLEIDGLNAASGRVLWTHPASPSSVTPGEVPTVAVTDQLVDYFTPSSDGGTQIVAVEAATGKQVWASPSAEFTSWPFACLSDSSAVCAVGSADGSTTQLLRLDGTSGQILASPKISGTSAGRSLGDGLFDPAQRNPEFLESVSGQAVTWKEKLAAAFPAPRLSTDGGWQFSRISSLGLYVGSVGDEAPAPSRTWMVTTNLADSMTAGFRISNGAPAWQSAHTTYLCGELACPGETVNGEPKMGVRVLMSGTATNSASAPTPKLSPDATATLQGFDLKTGRTTWSYNLGHDAGFVEAQGAVPQVSATQIVVPATDGSFKILNLTDGTTMAATPSVIAWCPKTVLYHTGSSYQSNNGVSSDQYVAANVYQACQPDGTVAATPKRVPAFLGTQYGTQFDGLTIWSAPGKVVAAPTGGG